MVSSCPRAHALGSLSSVGGDLSCCDLSEQLVSISFLVKVLSSSAVFVVAVSVSSFNKSLFSPSLLSFIGRSACGVVVEAPGGTPDAPADYS